uniref:Uncharacterized protein n=1 Tax=Bradyrhizobium amphicarpaeae TaxID=1404768 RepID=A0A2U8Q4D5_9BRAD|nr:hypothetical protein CIT40_32045 [Bradyrhizobium amphicarpaeae]
MRAAWTPHARPASPFAGEAAVSGRPGRSPVTIDQFPAVMLKAATPSAARQKAAYIAAWRRRFAST